MRQKELPAWKRVSMGDASARIAPEGGPNDAHITPTEVQVLSGVILAGAAKRLAPDLLPEGGMSAGEQSCQSAALAGETGEQKLLLRAGQFGASQGVARQASGVLAPKGCVTRSLGGATTWKE